MNYDTIKEEIKDIDITLPPPKEEPERQYYFIKKLQHWMELKKEEKGRELTCCVNTFGCQMNARDSEKIIGILMMICLLYTSPSPRDGATSRMPSSA